MPDEHPFSQARSKLQAWQEAHAKLLLLEAELSQAMSEYGSTLTEPPRALMIQAEVQRANVALLFEVALEALDAHCVLHTGHTNFETL